MNRKQILDLYAWDPGVCFRHPERGCVSTALVKTLHPRGGAEREVRACGDCVIAIEDARREAAARSGGSYSPGRVAEQGGMRCPGAGPGPDPWGESGE